MYIRNAVEADLRAIVTIYNASIPSRLATADLNPVSVESRLEWFYQHSSTSRPILIMEIDQVILRPMINKSRSIASKLAT